MSVESVRSVIERFLDYDYSALADDVVGEAIGLGLVANGPDGVQGAVGDIYEKMFTAEPQNKALYIDEKGGLLEFDLVGTHTGEVLGAPATGRSVKVPCISVYEVTGDKITAIRMYVPTQVLLDQIAPDR